MIPVDVITVLAPGSPVHPRVSEALEKQGRVALHHHLVEGPATPAGRPRTAAIAETRNRARYIGQAPYVMFLDSDVVLPPRAIEELVYTLFSNPWYAAIGVNYQRARPGPSPHVAMGALMFVREVLKQIRFRAEPGRCECASCCDDIRRMGYGIDYLPGLRAEHLR